MLRVMKGNQEFRIADSELTDYLKKGFDLIDERGQVVTLGTNEQSVEAIARENKELRRKNRLLEESVQQRDRTIAALRKPAAEGQPAEEPSEGNDESETSEGSLGAPAAEGQFVCPTCGKSCASALGLAKHRKVHG